VLYWKVKGDGETAVPVGRDTVPDHCGRASAATLRQPVWTRVSRNARFRVGDKTPQHNPLTGAAELRETAASPALGREFWCFDS
jgi:hypothetical protein